MFHPRSKLSKNFWWLVRPIWNFWKWNYISRRYFGVQAKFYPIITRRTCYFVNDIKRKRTLYLTLIRSQFEHCSPIWRPFSKTMLNKLEGLQKRCVKWILSEEYLKYNSYITYIQKCRQVNLLPLTKRFDLNDLIWFHKILYNLIPLKLPDYLSFFDGNSRLRSCHLDNLSIISSLQARSLNINCLKKSFFYRTHTEWNALLYL